ncbi:DUF116 domain-containing protein [Paenibacillus sp. BR2-3]|uniref:DUF116 domain-containing protein n=1 Tax=Paenibacillus sp. BR2-3 TaxID=3048494 RepID=UPI003977AAA7
MEAVTYSLYGKNTVTDNYYNDVSRFTDEVLDKANKKEIIEDFSRYVVQKGIEPVEPMVYVLEFLMIGVLWRVYSPKAAALNSHGGRLLYRLYQMREKNKRIKGQIDLLRGVLGTTLLAKSTKAVIRKHLDQLGKLIEWLQASGEFDQESKRIAIWRDFIKNKQPRESKHIISEAVQLGSWFEKRSQDALGGYTLNVDPYIENNRQRLKWKENMIFCTRERVEYHLNMVGAEIMNRSFKEAFAQTKEKRVLLPVCMKLKSDDKCRAVQTEDGYVCKGCSKDCQVNTITALGKEHHFKVLIIPHASTAFGQQHIKKGEVGIIGIACILNLISGGYKARELGYEPQCVLLNYSGCLKHWHKTGIVTDVDLNRLKKFF